MTDPADLVLTNGRVHRLAVPDPGDPRTWRGALAPDAPNDEPPEPDGSAIAIRDGEIVAIGSDRAVQWLVGIETAEIDLEGATILPGFIDAHTHLVQAGLALVHADLSVAEDREAALELLAEQAGGDADGAADWSDVDEAAESSDIDQAAESSPTHEPGDSSDVDEAAESSPTHEPEDSSDDWIVGVRYDESDWPSGDHPTRADLDRIADDRPVAAVRVDLHTAVLNSAALDLLDDPDPDDVETDDAGEPTGLVREDAVGVVEPVYDPGREATDRAVRAAIDEATRRGITGVHDKVRNSHAPRVYRDLDRADDLDCRIRIDYWADHREALAELGLRTGDGTELVQVGSLKTFTDGSIGGRSAKLRAPYADAAGDTGAAAGTESDGEAEDERGTWVVPPAELREIVDDATDARLQVQAHAIGDEAIGETIDALEASGTPAELADARHRIEHAELATDAQIERMAASGIVASMQPNFHRWARAGGLYETALGPERTARSNRLQTVTDAGVPLAFGSDGMPMDPLFGVEQAVTAPTDAQSLSVGAALVAYTGGAAFAGFDEDRIGSIEVGKQAALVALADSPWEEPESIADTHVALTVVEGRVVYDGR
ncbi:amidohydrolase [Salinarchaeum sp. Harcht-Bsk1]|uniref:amidohydrolase n=1 Tax=Salinarchaeum sp. Harcht-Bsk1 TaxID=1333523 RepID=UPI00034245E1|nr:amidohydrolase [Salinarchaeum sp. Harcht-Bsk1]AGN00675.1 amidohydrolase [Salinarchaeum sp. Harcht-Bsk1]